MGMANFKPRNTKRAQQLRREATPFERILWRHLSAGKLDGHKFSRQMPIGPYFVDFLCRAKKVVVGVDGFSHENAQTYDSARTAFLESEGFQVIRFTNDVVKTNIDGVVAAIGIALANRPTPNPSRKREGKS